MPADCRTFGKETYADYGLEKTMAENTANVYALLNRLPGYRPAQQREFAEIEFASKATGAPVKLNAWDYSYWANKPQRGKI